jgi:protein SERAC1
MAISCKESGTTRCSIVLDQVVYGDSAIIGDAREKRETIHADHIGMTKFSTKDDDGYGKILYAIEMLLEGQLGQPVPGHQSM